MIRRHPTSTLFPTTTLFRSEGARGLEELAVHGGAEQLADQAAHRVETRIVRNSIGFVVLGRGQDERGDRACLGQRQERSEEHTSELQSLAYLVCRLLLEKRK